MLTFYSWHGPVRVRKGGRHKGSTKVKLEIAAVRRAVQAQVRKVLPRIIREEVAAAFK